MGPTQPGRGSAGSAAKTALRDQVLTARRRRSPDEVREAAHALADHLVELVEAGGAATVAAYVSVGSEPGTARLLAGLRDLRRRVLLPVLLPDGDLDWSLFTGEADLAPARLGLLEPVGPRLGVDAVAGVDLVLAPGLAVSSSGERLGRGGGSYDRALARVPAGTPVLVVLHDDEVGLAVPVEPHDRPVGGVLTPSGVRWF